MLKANNKDGVAFISWLDEISKQDYFCPYCENEVSFVNSTYKIKHFRHKISSNCNPEPETESHINMKKYFYENLNLNKENIEVNLKFARPDIYLFDKKIAIEVQHSNLTEAIFLYRTKRYTDNDISVIWIFDESLLGENISRMLKKAHELYFGRIYVYRKNPEGIYPIHFESKGRWVDGYYSPEGEYYDGYYKYYKNKRSLNQHPMINNFEFNLNRNTWKDNNYSLAMFNDQRWWKSGN
jgi:competence CoiA-like predicted nuclease